MRWYIIAPFLLQTIVWIPVRITLVLFYGFQVRGLENLNSIKKGVIFAANHTSELDPILLPAALPFFSRLMPIFYTCREKSFYKDKKFGWRRYIYGGKFFNMWGAYEVILGTRNYELSLKNHLNIIRNGHSAMIFPEGKIRRGKQLEPKGGVAYLSFVTGVPIVPVRIDGVIEKKKVTLSIGKPICLMDIYQKLGQDAVLDDRENYKVVAKFIMKKIDELG